MPVVVVESPAKAKTINKYLGDDFKVVASYGHVRDLPAKDGSVDPEQGFDMKWEIGNDSRKHIKAISDALKKDNSLILATDPDREGEAISWHLLETLLKSKVINKDTPVRRVVFYAITKKAVGDAMQNPRNLDSPLVEAYLARRALDYLVGFKLSPVLWRKLPGSRSAGRVQSVCLRLIVEREMEIEVFNSTEYWSVKTSLLSFHGKNFEARLIILKGQKLGKYDLKDAAQADIAVKAISDNDFKIVSVDSKPSPRNPYAPFMTSTLQQEASRKFGFGARKTMSLAQKLYEAGHITYMRTDGIDMAQEAIEATRSTILALYGGEYLPKKPRIYKNRTRNAQEAHECIRPTNPSNRACKLNLLEADQRKLYDLIWKRTIACQMESAKLERTRVNISSADESIVMRASGQIIKFEGFLKVYDEGKDDSKVEENTNNLPPLSEGEKVEKISIIPEQHFTQPPARYTEATLVKRMEELGIGRPSTYASIVTTIQDREYVKKEQNRLIPEDKGRIVTIFLLNFFKRYIEYDFTAGLEDQLDHISAGELGYKDVLGSFWKDFSTSIEKTSELRIKEVLDVLDEALAPQLYPPRKDGGNPRICPLCGEGQLHLKTSRSGGFVGCGNYPECRYTRQIRGEQENTSEKILGLQGDDEILLRSGRYGPYVQRGHATENNPKPPTTSLPKGWSSGDLNLAKAIQLLSLPRQIGTHPEDGEPVEAGIGRYGPFVRHGKLYANLKDAEEVFAIGMNKAIEELTNRKNSNKNRVKKIAQPLKELGQHPVEGGEINVMDGRYGPYIKFGKINVTLPKNVEPKAVELEMAVSLITEKLKTKKNKTKKN